MSSKFLDAAHAVGAFIRPCGTWNIRALFQGFHPWLFSDAPKGYGARAMPGLIKIPGH